MRQVDRSLEEGLSKVPAQKRFREGIEPIDHMKESCPQSAVWQRPVRGTTTPQHPGHLSRLHGRFRPRIRLRLGHRLDGGLSVVLSACMYGWLILRGKPLRADAFWAHVY